MVSGSLPLENHRSPPPPWGSQRCWDGDLGALPQGDGPSASGPSASGQKALDATRSPVSAREAGFLSPLFPALMPDREGGGAELCGLMRPLGVGVGEGPPAETETRAPALGRLAYKKLKGN